MFLDFNDSQSRGVGLDLFPTIRFLPDEVFIIEFYEDDVTTHDEMTARIFPLGAEDPGAESDRLPIQDVSGDGGRYQIYGHKRHFGSRQPLLAPTACPDP